MDTKRLNKGIPTSANIYYHLSVGENVTEKEAIIVQCGGAHFQRIDFQNTPTSVVQILPLLQSVIEFSGYVSHFNCSKLESEPLPILQYCNEVKPFIGIDLESLVVLVQNEINAKVLFRNMYTNSYDECILLLMLQ